MPQSCYVLGSSGRFNRRYFLPRNRACLSFHVTRYVLLLCSLAGGLGAVWRGLRWVVPSGVCRGLPRDGWERGLHLYKLCQETPAGPQQPCSRPPSSLLAELQTTNGRSQGDELATARCPELVGKWTTGTLQKERVWSWCSPWASLPRMYRRAVELVRSLQLASFGQRECRGTVVPAHLCRHRLISSSSQCVLTWAFPPLSVAVALKDWANSRLLD